MCKKSSLVLFFIVFILSENVSAQKYLTLEDCRNLAIENNKSLKIATEEERVAYYQKKEALTKYFPEISFQGAYFRNQKNLNLIPSTLTVPNLPVISGITWPVPSGTEIAIPDKIRKLGEIDIQNVWLGGFNLIQPLFMGGKIIAYNDIQNYVEELSHYKKDLKLKDVIVELDNTYWQVVSLVNKKSLAQSYVNLLKKMESDISLMEQEGVATKADRLTIGVKLNEAEIALTKVENGVSLSKMLLCQICGIEIDNPITLKDESLMDFENTTDSVVMPNLSEALMNRGEVRSLELASKIYKKKEKIAISEFLPQLAFTANYFWTNPNGFNGFENKFGGMWNIGLLLKVPFNYGASSFRLSAAKSQTRIMEYELSEAKEKIKLQMNQSVYKLNEANKKLNMTNKNLEKANENLRYANAGFEEGVISASDALAAHTAWVLANSEYIDAKIDIRLCQIYLKKALGQKF